MKVRGMSRSRIKAMVKVTTDGDHRRDMVNMQVITDGGKDDCRCMGERMTATSI